MISFRFLGSQASTVPAFDKLHLLSQDPAWIVDIDPTPADFCAITDYVPDACSQWFYASDFNSTEWSETYLLTSCVRRRKLVRLLVPISEIDKAQNLRGSWLAKYRSIHPKMIQTALVGFEYKIEYVVEYQRYLRDYYDSYNLTYSDPAHWNYAVIPPPNITSEDHKWSEEDFIDPTSCPLSFLRPLDECSSFRLIDGWQILHDFIHILHPKKDEMGWEYSDSFTNDCERSDPSNSHWFGSRGAKPLPVRRRLWMRTLVRETDLGDCRHALDSFIISHPRGVIFTSSLQRRSYYRKRWCDATATLKDDRLEIQIENNYQKFVSYPLRGCEPVLLSHLSGESDLLNKFFLFGLRKIGGALLPGLPVENHLDRSGGILCIFNANSAEMRDRWISALTHQLLLVNTHRFLKHNCPQWSPLIGPPCLVDTPIIAGSLWKKGDFVWKLRTFELRKSGILAYFKRGRLIGEVKLLNECSIRVPPDVHFQYPFEIIASDGSIILELAASDTESRSRWMSAIRWSISASLKRKLSINAALAEGKTQNQAEVFWYHGEMEQLETLSVDSSYQNTDHHLKEDHSSHAEGEIYGSPRWLLMMVGLHDRISSHDPEFSGKLSPGSWNSPSEHYSHWTANFLEDGEDDVKEGLGMF